MHRHIVMPAAVAARAVAVASRAVAVAPRAVRIAPSAVAVAPRGVRVAPRAVAVAGAALVAIALSGCAVQVSTPVTDLEARDRFSAVLDDAQQIVGGEWSVMDDPTSRECIIPLWVTGERYPALRIGEAPASVTTAADRIEEAWTDGGMRVTRTDIGDVVEVKGESADGELLILRLSESASTLLGESECRPL